MCNCMGGDFIPLRIINSCVNSCFVDSNMFDGD